MNSMDTCIALLRAESEEEVTKILENDPLFSNNKNWLPLDGRETNFNVVTNQAMTGGKAATELMTNMVDALLMKEAYRKGIDPRGPDAPQTMHEAVKQLIPQIQVANLVDEDAHVLRDYAKKNLVVGVTGKAIGANPCFTFVDNGEGQPPERFEDTFLSLSAGHKSDIPFVQGKFNMGSSGVLSFCGRYWYKLILSRRYDGNSHWGWTILRRRPNSGIPIAEYFHLNKKISTFELPYLYPFQTGQKAGSKQYDGVLLETGTVIKLYDFQIGKKFRSFRGAREAFNENLVDTVLPFRLMDFRQTPDPTRGGDRALGIDVRPFYGMEYLLRRTHSSVDADSQSEETVETASEKQKLLVGGLEDPELGKIVVSAIPLERKLPGWLQAQNSANRVFHSVNGQVQFKESRGYLSRCRLPALKDRAVIIVDASGLTLEAHNDVWKGDREHVRETIMGERYKEVVRDIIEKSEALRDLHEEIAREELSVSSEKQQNELFQQLVNSDPTLAGLLSNKDPTITISGPDDPDKDEDPGAYSPTFFKVVGKTREFEVPINRVRSITAKTDAANNYFIRNANTGRIFVSDPNVKLNFSIRHVLKNGNLTLFFTPGDAVSVGQSFTFDVGLVDDAMAQPMTEKVKLTVIPAVSKPKPNPDPDDPDTKKKKKKKKKNKPADKATHGLPMYMVLTKDGREIEGHPTSERPEDWTDLDGGSVDDISNEERLYKINYDNSFHLKYKMQAKSELEKASISEKYITGMRLLLLGFERALDKASQDENSQEWISERSDEIRRIAANGAAQIVLAIAEKLPKISAASLNADPE